MSQASSTSIERFIERENIALFQRRMAEEADENRRRLLTILLTEARARLAVIEARAFGARRAPTVDTPAPYRGGPELDRSFREEFESTDKPLLLIDPGPGLRIVDANAAYVAATMIDRDGVKGRELFEVFPDNPGDPVPTGVANLFASLAEVVRLKRPHAMDIQRYDIRNAAGVFVERHWQPLNMPILGASGEPVLILHQVIDVTSQVLGRN